MASNSSHNPKKLPVPYKPAERQSDLVHQANEWSSGTRGGGFVPPDFGWGTNPKQHQEERGSGEAEKPISK